jgi:hypothetical protein
MDNDSLKYPSLKNRLRHSTYLLLEFLPNVIRYINESRTGRCLKKDIFENVLSLENAVEKSLR